jgi:hypothetical protein
MSLAGAPLNREGSGPDCSKADLLAHVCVFDSERIANARADFDFGHYRRFLRPQAARWIEPQSGEPVLRPHLPVSRRHTPFRDRRLRTLRKALPPKLARQPSDETGGTEVFLLHYKYSITRLTQQD